jgi:hypothetical protein
MEAWENDQECLHNSHLGNPVLHGSRSSRPRSASAPKLCDVGVKHLRCGTKKLKRMNRWKESQESLENTGHHWTNSIRIFMAVEANLVTPCDTFGIGASFGLKPLVKTRIVRLCMDNS